MMRSFGSSPAGPVEADRRGRVNNLCHVNYVTHMDHLSTWMIHVRCRSRDAVRADDRAPAGPDLRRAARRGPTAEAAGFETLFRSDHYESFPGATGEPTTDAWAVLAGLARDTTTIGLGTLVSPVTFRKPGNLAKVAITVDEMSGGRVEVGRRRRLARGRAPAPRVPVPGRSASGPTCSRRRSRSSTACGTSRTAGRSSASTSRSRTPCSGPSRRSLAGRANGGRPPIIVGGEGSPRSFRIAARYADEFNLSSSSPTGRDAEVRAARRDAAGGRPGPVDDRPLGDGRDADGPDDARDPGPRVGAPGGLRRAEAGRGVVRRRGAPAGSTGRPTRRARRSPRSRRPGSSGSCSRTSFPGTSR